MYDPAYPFVDCFWYDGDTNTVHACQISKPFPGHRTDVDAFNAKMEKLAIPDTGKLVVNIIHLPYQADGCAQANTVDIAKIYQNGNVAFRVIKLAL
ncbi:hypothetical protein H257_13972 [Aphanomyces astaci]|uniref:Uncharacterized protein n=1 Tax=Aphanomyces astaci TaxID=112090 RepID=W4FT18_APHAT|nr:hypothetical protein H257_13972 [Aphanomyces astaci]ETV70597.1 hypothetical protein H257_13972 [Aphanomyces astaci]|eukprot:XP_009839980.1 hypothetical protein H257_13972 [Aphanomyces astaci]